VRPRPAAAHAVMAALALSACIQQPKGDPALPDGPVAVEAQAVPFHAGNPDIGRTGRLAFRGAQALRSDDPRFGGFSALHVSADGRRMIALSDKGHRLTARLVHDADGNLAGIGAARIDALRDPAGRSVVATRLHDAESLTVTAAGFAVGFEGEHRLWLYPDPGRPFALPPRPLPPPPGLAAAHVNRGVEALARLGDGRLVALSEGLGAGPGRLAGWVGGAGGWRSFAWVRHGRYRPAAAVALSGGGVLVLERRFAWLGGFAARLVLVPDAAFDRDEATGSEVGALAPPLVSENFEGLAVRRGARGETLLYLVSDDNFHPLQKTLLVMLELTD